MVTREEVRVPASVPPEMRETYIENFLAMTRSTGRLMLFAGDQKVEHLNADFYGPGISPEDADPEHFFKIASTATVGCFAGQYGLIARYGMDYPGVGYLVKMNSKSPLVKKDQMEPLSGQLVDFADVLTLKENGLRVFGVGYTIYLGSENESIMFSEAAQLIADAHHNGMLAVIWIYPRGKAVTDEKDPELIAGACGVAASFGADFVKVNYPHGPKAEEGFKVACKAAGRTGVVCAGGAQGNVREFLQKTAEQLMAGGRGNATGRNVHQKDLDEAVRMCNAISCLVLGHSSVDEAMEVYEGKREFNL